MDVFTPSLDSKQRLPVMVYVHGGYLRFGNASTPGYYPDEKLAVKLNVVFVNIQYRYVTRVEQNDRAAEGYFTVCSYLG